MSRHYITPGNRPPARQEGASGAFPSIDPRELPAETVLGRLAGVRTCDCDPSAWRALCPAHPDTRPSLSIREREDYVLLLHCHRGCDTAEVLHSIGLTKAFLYPTKYAVRCAERDGRRTRTGRRVVARDTSGTLTDFDYDAWKALARCYEFVPRARAHVENLATDLGVSPDALAALEIGWDDVRKAWTVPERDHERRVVGVSFRHLTGEKTGFAGGHRGLILPHGLGSRPGPLHLAEGMSDTAALLSAGFAAAGRPQAKATGHVRVWATALAEDYARSGVVVVADADRAGIDGACDLAAHLQTALGTTVRVVLPAGKYKDCRDMLNSTGTITLITKED